MQLDSVQMATNTRPAHARLKLLPGLQSQCGYWTDAAAGQYILAELYPDSSEVCCIFTHGNCFCGIFQTGYQPVAWLAPPIAMMALELRVSIKGNSF